METSNNSNIGIEQSTKQENNNNKKGRLMFGAGVLAFLTIAGLWGKGQGEQVENIATDAGWSESSLHRSGIALLNERVSAITGVPSEEGIDPKKAKIGCEVYFGKGPVDDELGDIPADLPVVRVVNYQTGKTTWDDNNISPANFVFKYPECFGSGVSNSSDTMRRELAGLAVANGFTNLAVVNETDGRERLEVDSKGNCKAFFGFKEHPVTQEPQTYAKIEVENFDEIAVVEANPETVAETLEKKC
jgi:hypothetical protein